MNKINTYFDKNIANQRGDHLQGLLKAVSGSVSEASVPLRMTKNTSKRYSA